MEAACPLEALRICLFFCNYSNAAIRNAMDTLRDDKTKDDSGDKKSDQ
jgi:hypothetical protein